MRAKRFIAKFMAAALAATTAFSSVPVMAGTEKNMSSTAGTVSQSMGVTVSIDTAGGDNNVFTKYTVRFDTVEPIGPTETLDGAAIPDLIVFQNDRVSKPADPVLTGYDIENWYTKDFTTKPVDKQTGFFDEDGLSEYAINEYPALLDENGEMTLYAHYKLHDYEVVFDTDGGRAIDPVYLHYNEKVTEPVETDADPIKLGYRVNHWVDKESGAAWDFNDEIGATDRVLKPVYDDKMYTIKIDKNNDGSFETESEGDEIRSVREGTSYGKLPVLDGSVNTGTKKKTNFIGWKNSAGNTVSSAEIAMKDEQLSPEFETVDYAYNVNVHTNGVKGDYIYPAQLDALISVIPIPSKDPDYANKIMYVFDHWGNVDDSTQYSAAYKIVSDMDIYAYYREVPYEKNIEIDDGHGGTTIVPGISKNSAKKKIKDLVPPKKDPDEINHIRYEFDHWEFPDGSVADPETELEDGMILIPVYREIRCHIVTAKGGDEDEKTFLDEEEEHTMADVKAPKKSPVATPQKLKFIFDHWEYEGNQIGNNYPVLRDMTVTAKYSSVSYDYAVTIQVPGKEDEIFPADAGYRLGDIPKPTKDPDDDYFYVFDHWENGSGTKLSDDTMITSDMTIVAIFRAIPKSGTVTISGNGGNTTVPFTNNDNGYTVGDLLDYVYSTGRAVHDPVADETDHTRWVLMGYNDKNDNFLPESTVITDGLMPLKEIWVKVKYDYTVDFETTDSENIPRQYITSSAHSHIYDRSPNGHGLAIKPKDPSRDNMRFIRWNYKGKEWDFSEEVKENMCLQPVFAPLRKYTVTIDYLNGTKIVDDIYEESKIAKPDDAVATKQNEKFIGWYVKGTDGSILWNFNTDTVKGEMTLIPKFAKYLVRSAGDDGTVFGFVSDTDNHLVEAKTYVAGKHLIGWFKDAGLTDAWDFENDTVNRDMYLYPSFRDAVVVTVVNNVTSAPIALTEEYKIPVQPAVEPGADSKFRGWIADGETTIWDFNNRVVYGDVTLRPLFTLINEYQVDLGGGRFEGGENTIGYPEAGAETVRDLPIPVKDPDEVNKIRYEFVCWVDKDGNKIDPDTPMTKDLKLYAKWKEIPYDFNVIYWVDGDNDSRKVFPADKGMTFSKVPIPAKAPDTANKKRFDFDRWTNKTDGTDIGLSDPITADCEIVAKYTGIDYRYTVTIVKLDETGEETIISYFTASENNTIADVPVTYRYPDAEKNELYTFTGWKIKNGDLYTNIAMDVAITKDITLTPQYSVSSYLSKVIFLVDNKQDKYPAQYVESGHTVEKPEDPRKSGYKFLEWDKAGKIWDFNKPVEGNMTLDAKFISTVKYIDRAGIEDGVTMETDGSANGNEIYYLVKGQTSRLVVANAWSTSDKTVATVDKNGKITGKKEGTATITKKGVKKAQYTITVIDKKSGESTPKVSGNYITIKKGQKYQAEPAEKWSTSDKSVATVAKGTGKVTARNAGKATITEETTNTAYTVMVIAPQITPKTSKISVGGSEQFSLINADMFRVSWISSKPQIAKVADGMVIGVGKGTANIYAYVNGKKFTAKVTVTDTPGLTSGSSNGTINVGQTATLVSSKSDKNFDAKTADWKVKTTSSTSGDVVSIKKNKVTGLKEGTVVLEGVQNTASRTATINVKAMAQNTDIFLNAGKSVTARYYKVTNKNATWKIDDTSIATVTEKGKITGVKAGVTKLTCVHNGTTFTSMVHVETPTVSGNSELTKVKDNQYELTLSANQKYVINTPDVQQMITWNSNKKTVAMADDLGIIKTYAPGKAKITGNINGTKVTINVTVSGEAETAGHIHDYDHVVKILIPASAEHEGKAAHICSCGIYYMETLPKIAK